MRTIQLDQTELATSADYRRRIIGTAVQYTTPGGTTIDGTITEHPMHGGGLVLAVTTATGRWASVGPSDVLAVI